MNYASHAPYGVAMATALAQGTAIGAHGAGGFVSRLIRLPVSLLKVLFVWQRRIDERNSLRNLDAHLLEDMGMTRDEAIHEASIPFWRAS